MSSDSALVIIDHPCISEDMCGALAERRTAVLRNPAAAGCAPRHDLNLVDDDAAVARLRNGGKLYTNNESALAWVLRNDPDAERVRGIGIMKDKHAFRRLVQPLYPDYHFAQYAFDELGRVDPAALRYPLVLKPSVGFFSIGVFVIGDAGEWTKAVDALTGKWPEWKNAYSAGVLGDLYFSLEDYIRGDEFAIDAYYGHDGRAVVLNIMKHHFADAADVRDRLYCLYPAMMPAWAARFAAYLDRVGALLNLRDFPFHVEVRVNGDMKSGDIMPIEFNPLRFAGCCTTDLARHAFGITTWASFLDGTPPDWEAIAAARGQDCYSLIMLDKPSVPLAGLEFDYPALRDRLTEVLDIRTFSPESTSFGYVFARTPVDQRGELDAMLRSDLVEFLRPIS